MERPGQHAMNRATKVGQDHGSARKDRDTATILGARSEPSVDPIDDQGLGELCDVSMPAIGRGAFPLRRPATCAAAGSPHFS